MTPLLSVRALRKSYGALRVTDDVSLDVAAGELHAVIGPNGAGKTTLIHQLSGSLRSDSGTVHLAGEDITALPMVARVRRGLARSFQITSILDGFSVLENVALAVQARSGSSFRFFRPAATETRLNAEAMDALGRVGLAERHHPRQERRRATFPGQDRGERPGGAAGRQVQGDGGEPERPAGQVADEAA